VSTNYPQGQPEARSPFALHQPPKKKHALRNVLIGRNLDAGDKVTVIGDFPDGGDLGVTRENFHVKG
jgi:hypothetical protein